MKKTNEAAGTAKRYFHICVTINWFSYFIFVVSRPSYFEQYQRCYRIE